VSIAQSGAAPLGAIVTVLGAKASPARFRLASGVCVVGAGRGSDLVVASSTVSRSHVELTLAPWGVTVRDLGSRNGTFYLGHRVDKVTLALGSRFRIGDTEIALDPDTDFSNAVPHDACAYRGLVGVSAPMRRLFATLVRLEGSLVTVLVEGSSGVGKELIARALHDGSSVSNGPFVVVNCGAVARELLLSELFGHKRGAFTGAVEERRGAFERADGGTLFLDEIGELPMEAQPFLLRALEAGEVQPLGGSETRKVRTRIVAATNRDLEQELRAGRFREDLYFRLAVVRLAVPALRERPEDIELLARRFAAGLGLPDLPQEFLDALVQREWPGNARELRNAVQAFAALGTLPSADGAELPILEYALRKSIDPELPYAEQKEQFLDWFTRTYIQMLIARTNGNQSEAARISGLDRSYLGKLLAKHGVVKP
jgi:DNA-binding NtrC family response regulator